VINVKKAISLFAGAGGLDIGMKRAGFDIKLAIEIENIYCETLKSNFPDINVMQGDVMEYNRERVYQEAGLNDDEELDLIIGGSPCQSFSTAGKRQAFEDPRGQAMLKFAELVSTIQPRMFILENVRGLLSSALKHRPLDQRGEGFPQLTEEEKQGSALKYLLQHFKGYRVQDPKLLNAADYGVAQKRERVFIIGVREDLEVSYVFPETTHNKDGMDGKESWVTLKEILSTLNVSEYRYMNYSKERLKWMKLIPQGGGNWRDLRQYGEDVVKEAMGGAYESGGGKVGFYRRVDISKPAPTLLTSPAQKSTNLGHPFDDRPLSIEEYLAIQEFPEGYIVAGTLHQQYTQIGNAVPIRLAHVLGKSIHNLLENVKKQRHRLVSNMVR
jgi:DNA (cytosine-5)-methyltransferase 1